VQCSAVQCSAVQCSAVLSIPGVEHVTDRERVKAGSAGPGLPSPYSSPRGMERLLAVLEPGAGSREPGDGSWEQGAGSRETGDGSREPGDGRREPGDGSREPGDGSLEPGGYTAQWGRRLFRLK
jgi:hypothetical protein